MVGRAASILFHPLDTITSAAFDVDDYASKQKAWRRQRILMPPLDTLFEIKNRGLSSQRWFDWAISHHGVANDLVGRTLNEKALSELWWDARQLKRAVPGAEQIAELFARDLLDGEEAEKKVKRAGGDWEAFSEIASKTLTRPDIGLILDLFNRGFLTDQEADKYATAAGAHWFSFKQVAAMARSLPGVETVMNAWASDFMSEEELQGWITLAGGNPEVWMEIKEWFLESPTVMEALLMRQRGLATQEEFIDYLERRKIRDPNMLAKYTELQKSLPTASDLIHFGVREAFLPDIAGKYGQYHEFPEESRQWWGKLGYNYGLGFQIPVEGGNREATLPDLHWAAHWTTMPLAQAYRAYHRFRPDQMHRYRHEVPGIKPFELRELQEFMKLVDLPPGVRDWMTALGRPQLTRTDVEKALQYRIRDRQWALVRFADLGYDEEGAQDLADIQEAKVQYIQDGWLRRIYQGNFKKTIEMIQGLYEDGTIERDFAILQITQVGVTPEFAVHLLDLVDFKVERKLVGAAIRETGADYLSGELSLEEADTQLVRIGVSQSRRRNYLYAWQVRRNRRRKQAETAKITGWLAAGLLEPGEARSRLLNLGWTDPDAALLLSEAAGKLAKRLVSEEKARESDVRRRAKELERLAKDAEAQSRKLRTEANRVAPRSTLMQWVRNGQISDEEFRSLMAARGYPEDETERYLQDAKREKSRGKLGGSGGRPFPRPEGSAHPPAGTVGGWLKKGVITEAEYREYLSDLGYGDEDVDNYTDSILGEEENGEGGDTA